MNKRACIAVDAVDANILTSNHHIYGVGDAKKIPVFIAARISYFWGDLYKAITAFIIANRAAAMPAHAEESDMSLFI